MQASGRNTRARGGGRNRPSEPPVSEVNFFDGPSEARGRSPAQAQTRSRSASRTRPASQQRPELRLSDALHRISMRIDIGGSAYNTEYGVSNPFDSPSACL